MEMSKKIDTGGEINVGYKIRERREMLKMTQEELAQKSGVSRQTISNIENNAEYNMSTKTLQEIVRALDTTIGELFFDESV